MSICILFIFRFHIFERYVKMNVILKISLDIRKKEVKTVIVQITTLNGKKLNIYLNIKLLLIKYFHISDYNYMRNETEECVLVPGAQPLLRSVSEQCADGDGFWYELSG